MRECTVGVRAKVRVQIRVRVRVMVQIRVRVRVRVIARFGVRVSRGGTVLFPQVSDLQCINAQQIQIKHISGAR